MDGITRTLIPWYKIYKGNRPSLNTSSMAEQSGVAATKKIPNVKWKGWQPRGRLEQRAITACRIYTYTFNHSQYKQDIHTTHNPLTINFKLDTPTFP
jgi:hypothetical protein